MPEFEEPDAWIGIWRRMGPTCYFGPWTTREEAERWMADNHLYVMLVPVYKTLNWDRL